MAPIPASRPVTVEVLTDGSWHMRRPVNGNEIIERPLTVGELTGRDVVLAAGDYNMLYQASAAGLKARDSTSSVGHFRLLDTGA